MADRCCHECGQAIGVGEGKRRSVKVGESHVRIDQRQGGGVNVSEHFSEVLYCEDCDAAANRRAELQSSMGCASFAIVAGAVAVAVGIWVLGIKSKHGLPVTLVGLAVAVIGVLAAIGLSTRAQKKSDGSETR